MLPTPTLLLVMLCAYLGLPAGFPGWYWLVCTLTMALFNEILRRQEQARKRAAWEARQLEEIRRAERERQKDVERFFDHLD